MTCGYIYFLDNGRAIKIGFSKDVMSRVATLQTGSHDTLSLLAIVRGTYKMEHLCHSLFREYRLRGEWFERRSEIMQFIRVCVAYGLAAAIAWRQRKLEAGPRGKRKTQPQAKQPKKAVLDVGLVSWASGRLDAGDDVRDIERRLRENMGASQSMSRRVVWSARKAELT